MGEKTKKLSPDKTTFLKALQKRLFGAGSADLEAERLKAQQEDEEIKKYAEERRDSIRQGARRAPKRFRP